VSPIPHRPLACLSRFALAVTVALLLAGLAMAQEGADTWPRFRGLDGSGLAPAATVLPPTWDAATGKGIVWQTELPLPGSSSPVIWGRYLFVTGANADRREVYCLDTSTGQRLWTTPVGPGDTTEPPIRLHEMTDSAAPTGTTDGERFYAAFATGHVAALDFSGKTVWQRRLETHEDIYGHSTSLVLHGDLLYVQLDLGKPDIGKSHLLALNRLTGATVWDVPRPVQGSWTTPLVISTGQREELVTSAKPWVIAYDPATGAEYWRANCIEGDSAPSPIFANGLVMVANIYAELTAIHPGGQGDVTTTHVAWSVKGQLPDICSPLSDGKLVFTLASGGALSCYDANDGALLWTEKLEGRYRASPSLVGDTLVLFSETGEAALVRAARECERLGTASLGEAVYSTPAFAGGRMHVRGERHVFCVGAE
jgi:outer membrane protein assembly factor BamB